VFYLLAILVYFDTARQANGGSITITTINAAGAGATTTRTWKVTHDAQLCTVRSKILIDGFLAKNRNEKN
jgi:hypothetical protein